MTYKLVMRTGILDKDNNEICVGDIVTIKEELKKRTDKLAAQDWQQFKRDIIEYWTRRPVVSLVTGKIVGYIKLEVK